MDYERYPLHDYEAIPVVGNYAAYPTTLGYRPLPFNTYATTPTQNPGGDVIYMDGASDYYFVADGSLFQLSTWTLECWIWQDLYGVIGSGGGATGRPIISKGCTLDDTNFWMGIDANQKLRGAFEDVNGINRSLVGTRVLELQTWLHVAVSYDGTNLRAWVMGILDKTTAAAGPCKLTNSRLAIGANIRLNDLPADGRWHGMLRNIRVWDNNIGTDAIVASARSRGSMVGASGLVAEWSFAYGKNVSTGFPLGTHALGSNEWPNWLPDSCPFQLDTPGVVTITGPADLTSHAGSVTVNFSISDVDANANHVEVWIRRQQSDLPFIIPFQPDPQFLTESFNLDLNAQATYWNNQWATWRAPLGINGGDCVNVANDAQYAAFKTNFMDILNSRRIAYAQGNHDQDINGDPTGTVKWNATLGSTFWSGRSEFVARYTGNDIAFGFNDYSNVAIEGSTIEGNLDFLVISLAYDTEGTPDPGPIAWCVEQIEAHPNHLVIINSHHLIEFDWPGAWTAQGQLIFDAVKKYRNVCLMTCGHLVEGRRMERYVVPGVGMKELHVLQADYQGQQANANRDKFRTMEFRQRDGVVIIKTYSPGQAIYELDSTSDFTIPFDFMDEPWTLYTIVPNVANGGTGSVTLTLPPGPVEVFFRAKLGRVARESARRGYTIT